VLYASAAEGTTSPADPGGYRRGGKRYGVRVRQLDMRRYDQEVETIIELSNASLTENWGYSPVTEDEVRAMARDMKPIHTAQGRARRRGQDRRPIGFAIALPDVNSLLKGLNGRLFPFGFLRLLRGIPRLRRYRMFALGVIPEYHGKAVDACCTGALYESLYAPDNVVGDQLCAEDNWMMVNAVHKLGPSRCGAIGCTRWPLGEGQ